MPWCVQRADGMAPEMTTTSMEVAFEKLGAEIRCEACKASFNERVAQVLQSWAQLQVRVRVYPLPVQTAEAAVRREPSKRTTWADGIVKTSDVLVCQK